MGGNASNKKIVETIGRMKEDAISSLNTQKQVMSCAKLVVDGTEKANAKLGLGSTVATQVIEVEIQK
ncbi:MAG: hypothetical protein K6E54_01855 [Bacteroidaceae bacterium]|nr:hypothetical protein [Bacteroidaceae bacterium]